MAKKQAPKPSSKTATSGLPPGLHAMRDLHKMLGEQNFQSEAEIVAFMNKMVKEGIPEFEPGGLAGEAEALVEQAMGKTTKEAAELARKALGLDTECIPAYVLLAHLEELNPVRAALFKRGVDIGMDRFGGAYMQQNRGHFWGLVETRPYMRCLHGYAESLFDMGQLGNALNIWMEMLQLNPDDNGGVRETALLALAALGEKEHFAKLDAQFEDDDMCGTLYNRALMVFNQKNPDLKKAANLLQAAIKRNAHVPALLFAAGEPEFAGAYTVGSREEALNFARFAWGVWLAVPNALEWLEEMQQPKLFKV